MAKNKGFKGNLRLTNTSHLIFLAFAMVCITLFMLNLAFAGDLASSKQYSSIDKTYTLKDNTNTKIADIKLNTPIIYNVIRGKDRLVAEFEINSLKDLDKIFNSMDFYDLKKGSSKINRNFKYKYIDSLTPNIVPYQVCDEPIKNETPKCSIAYRTDYIRNWKELDTSKILSTGKITIGVFADVNAGDTIEWIPTIAGQRLNEWAVWNDTFESGLLSYWSFNTNGDDNFGTHNLVGINSPIHKTSGGINSGCYNFTYLSFLTNATAGTGAVGYPTGNQDSTINLWMIHNLTQTATEHIFEYGVDAGGGRVAYVQTPNILAYGSGSYNTITNTTIFNNDWNMITLTKNSNNTASIYINGNFMSSANGVWTTTNGQISIAGESTGGIGTFAGLIDEVAVWSRTLSPNEIVDLYNGGIGIFLTPASLSTLNSPADNLQVLKNSNVNFNCSASSTTNQILNISLWTNITGTFILNQTQTHSGSLNQTDIFTVTVGNDNFIWNCRGCDNASNCQFASANRTLRIGNLIENSLTYSNMTIEGNVETFNLNTTLSLSETFSSAYLVYNGTSYLTSSSFDGTNWILSKSINIPYVTTDTNKSFYFTVNMVSGSANTDTHTQLVRNLAVDNCTTYTNLIYNFTIRDEGNRSILNYTSNPRMNIDLRISAYGSYNPFLNYSHAFDSNESKIICLNVPLNNSLFRADIIADYEADNYVKEFYYMDNELLSNSTTPINKDLYSLLATDSTTFLMKFTDINGNIMPNAIIHIYRLYVSDGNYTEVETSKQDESGQSLAHLLEEDALYYFTITLDNSLVFTTGTYTAKCTSTPCEIDLTASATYTPFPVNWNVFNGTSYYLLQNRTTRCVTLYFNSNTPTTVNLTIGRVDNGGITLVNSSQLYATSGTLNMCVPHPYGNQTFFANVWINGVFIKTELIDFNINGRDIFGVSGAILGFFMLLAVVLMGVSEGPFLIVIIIVSAILISIMAIVDLGWLALISIICAGGSLLYHFIRRRK